MLLCAIFDLWALVTTIMLTVNTPVIGGGGGIGSLGIVCLNLRWGFALFNETFFIFHGHLFSNTIVGTIFFQQCIYFPLSAFATAIALWRTMLVGNPWGIILLARGLLDLSVWVTVLIFIARSPGNKQSINWAMQVEELTGGAYAVPHAKISWQGIPRRASGTPSVRAVKAIRRFWRNALFRRVRPVEMRFQAIWMHLFALTAILLILIRTLILLVQLGNEDLPSRTLVEPCVLNGKANETLLYVHFPEYQEDPTEISRGWGTNNRYNISFIYQLDMYTGPRGLGDTHNVSSYPCDNYQMGRYYYILRCTYPDVTKSSVGLYPMAIPLGYAYTITSPETNRSRHRVLPSIWLAKGILSQETGNLSWNILTPRLVPPFQPVLGVHTVFETHYSKRKFISSPALFDAIFDSKPAYETIDLYTWYHQSGPHARRLDEPLESISLNTSNAQVVSTGFIQWPSFIKLSPHIPRNHLVGGEIGSADLCEVTEEYRTGSTFDILASIGGLFALFQGLHVFLFGRPLFWGLFGAKLITPFGFVGQFAGKDFKQRLREHYDHSNDPENAFRSDNGISREEENIHMTRFLLEYVIDLGPASVTSRVDRRGDVESLEILERGPLLNES